MKKLTILVLMLAFAWGASAQFYMHVWYNDSLFSLPVLNVDSVTFTNGPWVEPEIPVIEGTITIDGDNTDWATFPMLTEPGAAGPVVKMIIPQEGVGTTLPDDAAFAVMVEGDHEQILADYPVIYADADMSTKTGGSAWYCPIFGKDYELATWSEGTWFEQNEAGSIREMCLTKAAFTSVPFTGSLAAWLTFNWGALNIPAMPSEDGWMWSETKYHPFYVRPFSYAKLDTIHTAGDAYATHRALLPGESLQLSESGNDTALWVSWAVELKEATTYNVYINVNATNMTSIDLWLVDPATNEVVAEFKGEDIEAPVGVTAYGTWDLSAVPAGKYMLKAKNHVQWSNLVFRSVSFEIAGGGTTDEPSTPSEPETPSEGIGVFSVSADKKVTFSPGNLQYHPANNEWRFAESQTDYIGEANSNCYSTYNGWLDLFGWSTSANYFGVSSSYDEYDYRGSFVDWGTNPIGDDAPNTWRTLTYDEWEYLFNNRNNASSLRGVAQVNGVNGLIFLPDTWTCPEGIVFKSGSHSNRVTDYSVYQSFNQEQWSKLEKSGAVFLPAAGFRYGSGVYDVYDYGYYWSATEYNDYNAYYLYFGSNEAYMGYSGRDGGPSVRLVKDVEDEPVEPEQPDEPVDPEPEPEPDPIEPYKSIGIFTVGEGKTISFAPGNLQYHPANNEWRFAESQLDYIGAANSNCSSTYNGWLDMFGWSTSATIFGVSNSTSNSSYSGSFVDWGVNKIGNDAPNTWRTLTYDEWNYLLKNRPNASSLCGVAQVSGVNGFIFLPDNWTRPDGVTFKSGFHSESGVDYYAAYQTFTADQWSKLEAAGAVFLPASGRRRGSDAGYVQNCGYYWSATEGSSYVAYSLGFYSDEAYVYRGGRDYGHSVRLVKDVEGENIDPEQPGAGEEPEEPSNPEEAYTHISKSLQTIKEAGDLYMVGDAEDKSWILEVLIEDYTDYGTYDDIIGIYTDATGEYDIIGSGTFGYNEELSSNIFEGTMQTEDGALVLNVLMYYLDNRVPIPIIIKGATFEYNGNSPLYINGTWNDGETVHTIMFECLEGLLIDKTDTEVQMLLDGGPMQGGSFAQSKDAIITKDGDILTLKGQFERYADGTLFDVTVTNL